jgi:hypothetical protein
MEHGNIKKLLRGMQTVYTLNGSTETVVCGLSPGFEAKGLLYWCQYNRQLAAYPNQATDFQPVCVATCPGDTSGYSENPLLAPAAVSSLLTPVPPECSTYAPPSETPMTAAYSSIEFLGRYCIPHNGNSSSMNLAVNVNSSSILGGQVSSTATETMASLESVMNAWKLLLAAFAFAILMGYLFLVMLKTCAKTIIVVTAIFTVLASAALGACLFFYADDIQAHVKQQMQESQADVPTGYGDSTAQTSRIIGALLGCLSIVLLCSFCCLRHSIDTAIAVVHVTCECLFDMPILLVSPLMKAAMKGAAFLAILYGIILCWTTADPTSYGDGFGLSRKFEHTPEEKAVFWSYVFVSLWILCFLDAFYQFFVAYLVADYYYAPLEGNDKVHLHQCETFFEAIRHGFITHAGSLAFGSLLIATLSFIQKLLQYANKQNKEHGNNPLIHCIICILLCCFQCCKEIIEFINKNAYIDIAVTGVDGFCEAAKTAMHVIIQEGSAMAVLNGATYVFSFFGSVLITLSTGGAVYLVASHWPYEDFTGKDSENAVTDVMAVTVVAMLIGFIVSAIFMSVFDMASDTLLYCVGFDRLKGHRCPTAPPELQELIDHGDHEAKNVS